MTSDIPQATTAQPLISVIVPVYNVQDYVAACLDSLRDQTLTDFEVIVVDDGSTDDSAARAQSAIAGDPRFTLISQDNRGLSGARNTGLDAARGAFIAFVDSDDRVMPNFLHSLHTALEATDADWVACAVRFCLPDGTGQPHPAIHGAGDLSAHRVQRIYSFESWADVVRHFPSAWNKLYRRHLIDGLRFDEGVWFEDHSFFQRAAARTDHILHLPDALYLQTQGRDGQITGADDDRVFEQLDVLRGLRKTLDDSHAEGQTAFARLATRLIYERSTALRDPDRRRRFAQASAAFLESEGIAYDPVATGDDEITHSWALEMAGTLPLSVVIPWHGRAPHLLEASLRAIDAAHGPGLETLIVCDTRRAEQAAQTIAAQSPNARVLRQRGRGAGAARNHGLAAARGHCVTFLDAGDTPHSWAYLRWTDAVLSRGADMAMSQFRMGSDTHTGFHDPRLWPTGVPASGLVDLTPMQMLTLEAQISAKIFDRHFLLDSGLRFDTGDRPDWGLVLAAALRAQRIAYCSWAGVTVSTAPEAQEVQQGPVSGRRLRHGHRATLRTLRRGVPTGTLARLPQGWERRLYARALRMQLHFGQSTGGSLRRMLVGAALGAVWHGYGQSRLQPAGLDPFVGPRQALILDKSLLFHAVAAKLRGRPVPLANPNQSVEYAAGHHAFALHGSGVFRFNADFIEHDYANLSFHCADVVTIPFHLSLRFHEGVAVINDTRTDGVWRAERAVPLTLPRSGIEVAIHLSENSVRVIAGGQIIFDVAQWRPWRRNGLSNLGAITTFTVQGGLRPTALLPQTPAPGALILDTRMQVRTAFDDPETRLIMTTGAGADTGDQSLPLLPSADGYGRVALLPGRIWNGLAPDAALDLQLTDATGTTLGSLTLTRADMAQRITHLLDLRIGPEDATLVLLIIEHLKFGQLMPLLPPRAQDRARTLAQHFDQADALADPSEARATDSKPIDAHAMQFNTALAEFSRSQAMTPPADPLDVLRMLDIDPEPRTALFLTLSEFFCRVGQDTQGFVDLADALGLPLPSPDGHLPDPLQDPWTVSALLPFLVLKGQADVAGQLLWSLGDSRQGWVLTPPVAWTVRRLFADIPLPDATRRAFLYGFMHFIDTRAWDYWARTSCEALIQASVALLCGRDMLPYPENQKIADFCLRNYGLSRVFWEALDAAHPTNTALPAPLQAARAQFDALWNGSADRDAALEFFRRYTVAGSDRFLRELSVQNPTRLSESAVSAAPTAALIRHAALPGTTAQTPPGAVADAVIGMHDALPHAPYPAVQVETGQMMRALWQGAEIDKAALDRNLTLLAQAESQYLGLALGITRAQMTGDDDDLNWLTDRIEDIPQDTRPSAMNAVAVRMALTALPDPGPEWAAPLRALLPDPTGLPRLPKAEDRTQPIPAPFVDTLVVVFSCQAYLDTRIPALRDGWLSQLKDLGVPYIVVVGDGDDRQEGDIVYLNAPDDYEGLPQKTLKTIAWVRDNTRYAYMLKIDDDCFLNAPLYFDTLTYRKFDYFGRRLTRVPGQMDRAWHQSKSSSTRGRMEFDKSIEPSSYADGGSGYSLSRDAMEAALDAAASPEGQQLIQVSFMEDKMLGDLLALRGIGVSEEDYRVTVRRRTHSDAIPVASWQNGFLPSQDAPMHLAHLDTHLHQADALATCAAPGLWPRKIWPTFMDAELGYQTNALELISDERTVEAARQAQVAVVACMRNEMFMLPHFLDHHRKLGVDAFLIADNCSDDGSLEYLAQQPDVALFSVDTNYNLSQYGVAWQQAMLAAFRTGKWSLIADADELLVWEHPQRSTLPDLVGSPAFAKADAARIFMLDMYPQGSLEAATFASGDPFAEAGFTDMTPFLTDSPMRGPFSDQPAWTSALRHRLIPGSNPNLFVAQKYALLRYHPWMRLSAGLHFVADIKLAQRELFFAHFKYNAAFRDKAKAEVARGQHFNNAEEYQKYLALASEGRDTIYDPGLSVPWTKSPFVAARLG